MQRARVTARVIKRQLKAKQLASDAAAQPVHPAQPALPIRRRITGKQPKKVTIVAPEDVPSASDSRMVTVDRKAAPRTIRAVPFVVTPKRRGRPPKPVPSEPPAKRPRGRPAGSVGAKKKAVDLLFQQELARLAAA